MYDNSHNWREFFKSQQTKSWCGLWKRQRTSLCGCHSRHSQTVSALLHPLNFGVTVTVASEPRADGRCPPGTGGFTSDGAFFLPGQCTRGWAGPRSRHLSLPHWAGKYKPSHWWHVAWLRNVPHSQLLRPRGWLWIQHNLDYPTDENTHINTSFLCFDQIQVPFTEVAEWQKSTLSQLHRQNLCLICISPNVFPHFVFQ